MKETRTIKEGGYYHIYSAIDTVTFKIQTQKKVKELEANFHRLLKKFEDNMEVVSAVYNNSPTTK